MDVRVTMVELLLMGLLTEGVDGSMEEPYFLLAPAHISSALIVVVAIHQDPGLNSHNVLNFSPPQQQATSLLH
jgi:hypothetical protein